MTELDYKLVDFDTHYYEPLDALTRFLSEDMKRSHRGVELVTQNGRTYPMIGRTMCNFVPNVTFSQVAAPGSMEAYFRGELDGASSKSLAEAVPLKPEYQQRAPREQVLTQQGVEECVILPTFACGVEEALSGDIEAMNATLSAFNRWLDAEWGFSGPIIAAPIISMSDVGNACAEIEWALERGARVLNMSPGPVRLDGGRRCSPANRRHDPVWQLINDAGIAVAYHAADAGYFRYFTEYDDPPVMDSFSRDIRLGALYSIDRPMQDTLAAMIMQKLFDRFPNLRIVSVEQGSDWFIQVLDKLYKQYKRRPKLFAEDPHDTVRRNVYMCPFWEDDIEELTRVIGVSHVVFGSDWPHPEGVAEPRDFIKYLGHLDAAEVRQVMRENAAGLLTLRPV